jgi:hypothetical protein
MNRHLADVKGPDPTGRHKEQGPSTVAAEEGLRGFESKQSDSTQPNGTTQQVLAKAVFTQIAELALAGHSVHELSGGAFLVTKYGLAKHCEDFEELQLFARKLGASK